MTSLEHSAPKSPTRAHVDFDDAELDRYLEENRRPGGETIVDVEGWENLPKDRQDQFIQRLRDRAQNASAAVQSRPVDLGQVNAQLLGLSGENTSSTPNGRQPLRHERASTEPLPGIEFYQEQERVLHEELVNAGVRPWYPISLIKDVSENPDKYREMLSFWAPADHEWMVFEKQLGRWHEFRIWQQDHRGVDDVEGEFAADIERRKSLLAKIGETWGVSQLEGEERLAEEFEWFKEKREWRRETIREEYVDVGFRGYVQAVKKRLARHGLTRAFKLYRDPTRQNKLTTWIEYLNYEYWWYDQYMADVKRLQPRYDKAWKELVDSNVLRSFETEEFILDVFKSALHHEREEATARRAVESAKSAAMSALMTTEKARKNPQHPTVPKQERMRMLAAAQSRLDKANKSLELIKTRDDLITVFHEKTRSYQIVKEKADNHSILLRWILEQIPLIEAELNESKVAGGTSVDTRGRKRRFRRDQDDATTEDQNSNLRRGNDDRRNSLLDNTTSYAQTKSRPKRSCRDDTINEEPSSKRFKLSGPGLSVRHTATSGSTDATSIGGTRGSSGTLATSNWDGGENPLLKIMEGPDVKISNANINRPLRSTDASQASEISPRLRHSARIATRQNLSRIIATSRAVKNHKSQQKVAQAPMPPPSTALQDRQSTFSARKRRGIKEGNQFDMLKQNGILKRGRRQGQSRS